MEADTYTSVFLTSSPFTTSYLLPQRFGFHHSSYHHSHRWQNIFLAEQSLHFYEIPDRNLSSAKQSYRQAMRKCRGLIDSLVRYVEECVQAEKPDHKVNMLAVPFNHSLALFLTLRWGWRAAVCDAWSLAVAVCREYLLSVLHRKQQAVVVSLVASVSISRATWPHYNKAGLGLLIQEMVLIFLVEKIYSQPHILIDLLVQGFYSF